MDKSIQININLQNLYIVLGVMAFAVLLSLVFRKTRQWFKRRYGELDLLGKYFKLVALQWQALIWGGSVLAIAFGWHFVTSDWPYPVKISACVVALFFAGYYIWRADHIRLQKKLEIASLCINKWVVPQGQANVGHHVRGYYFGVFNSSEGETVQGVIVQLNRILPEAPSLSWLPLNLHLQHDNPSRPEDQAKSFDLNPGALRNIDFVTALEGNTVFSIEHVVPGANHIIPFDTGGHRLQVMVTATHMPKLLTWFKVWRDDAGLLMCEREQ